MKTMTTHTPNVEILRQETPEAETSSTSLSGPSPAHSRCQHRYGNGTQSRLRSSDVKSGLCSRHFTQKVTAILPSLPNDSADLSTDLLPELSQCSSSVDLRKLLSRLLVLLTQGRVSPRRASVLAYITHQLLHSPLPSKKKPVSNLASSLLRLARNATEQSHQREKPHGYGACNTLRPNHAGYDVRPLAGE